MFTSKYKYNDNELIHYLMRLTEMENDIKYTSQNISIDYKVFAILLKSYKDIRLPSDTPIIGELEILLESEPRLLTIANHFESLEDCLTPDCIWYTPETLVSVIMEKETGHLLSKEYYETLNSLELEDKLKLIAMLYHYGVHAMNGFVHNYAGDISLLHKLYNSTRLKKLRLREVKIYSHILTKHLKDIIATQFL